MFFLFRYKSILRCIENKFHYLYIGGNSRCSFCKYGCFSRGISLFRIKCSIILFSNITNSFSRILNTFHSIKNNAAHIPYITYFQYTVCNYPGILIIKECLNSITLYHQVFNMITNLFLNLKNHFKRIPTCRVKSPQLITINVGRALVQKRVIILS